MVVPRNESIRRNSADSQSQMTIYNYYIFVKFKIAEMLLKGA